MLQPNVPTVSVIMPVFNVEPYVADAIRSVLAQSFTDFELIIVDDGGTDRSVEICQSFDDRRIRIVSQANRGLAGARNTGIGYALGRYIALIDSDDFWLPEKLAVHVAHLDRKPTIGASYGGAELIDAAGRRLGLHQRPKRGEASAKDVFCGRAIMNGSIPVFRKEMLEESVLRRQDQARRWYFDETLRRSEDVECWTRIAITSSLGFEAVPEELTLYRVNSNGLSADVVRQLNSWDQVCASLERLAPDFIAAHRSQARARELRYLARRCVQIGDRGLGLTLIAEAIRLRPALLIEDPIKTMTTLVACAAMRYLPAATFSRLLGFANPTLAQGAAQ